MSKFETAFKAAIAENERRILIETLRSSPDLTIGEIHKLAKGGLARLFAEITIADLLGGPSAPARAATPVAAPARRVGGFAKTKRPSVPPVSSGLFDAPPAAQEPAQGKPVRRPVAAGKSKVVNTRTVEGRAAYDEALFQAVADIGGPAGAGAIIARAGGTSLQARAGLARLIEAGRLNWSGKARGTKYTVA